MTKTVLLLVGTRKGVFLLEGDGRRNQWGLRGPFCEAWPINHVVGDPASGAIYAAGGNEWFGPAVWKSEDLGATWTHSSEGLAFPPQEDPVKAVWSLAQADGRLYAGVEPAGLFRSNDGGATWQHVAGLRDHPSRPEWQPGGGGLILHAVLPHPEDGDRLWVAISTGGVFSTADGGKTWEPRNKGTRNDFLPEEYRYAEYGQCVHSLVMAPGLPDRLYQQNHCGMYRSDDGGRGWDSIEPGLPSTFGFPAAAHPRDPETLYLVPLNGDSVGRYMPEAKAAVWRTRDGGATWQDLRAGLPQENAFLSVYRQALATDPLEPAGVYFGTTSGALFASTDEGDTWTSIAQHLPAITSVETLVVGG
ncbi:MAG: exo-alpha-sialidase [Rhodospirillales bacterium]|nr:exo-alpha-sialidase [Rhodospirillales bacterium]